MCKANSYRHRCVSVPALSFLLCHIFNAQRGFRRSFRRGSLSQSAILQMRCRATVGVASGERPRDMVGAITCWIFFVLLYILSLTERVSTQHIATGKERGCRITVMLLNCYRFVDCRMRGFNMQIHSASELLTDNNHTN